MFNKTGAVVIFIKKILYVITQVSHPINSLKMSNEDKEYLIESNSCVNCLYTDTCIFSFIDLL